MRTLEALLHVGRNAGQIVTAADTHSAIHYEDSPRTSEGWESRCTQAAIALIVVLRTMIVGFTVEASEMNIAMVNVFSEIERPGLQEGEKFFSALRPGMTVDAVHEILNRKPFSSQKAKKGVRPDLSPVFDPTRGPLTIEPRWKWPDQYAGTLIRNDYYFPGDFTVVLYFSTAKKELMWKRADLRIPIRGLRIEMDSSRKMSLKWAFDHRIKKDSTTEPLDALAVDAIISFYAVSEAHTIVDEGTQTQIIKDLELWSDGKLQGTYRQIMAPLLIRLRDGLNDKDVAKNRLRAHLIHRVAGANDFGFWEMRTDPQKQMILERTRSLFEGSSVR